MPDEDFGVAHHGTPILDRDDYERAREIVARLADLKGQPLPAPEEVGGWSAIRTERSDRYDKALLTWIVTVRKWSRHQGAKDFLPGEPDLIKSRLFWRCRGGEPLEFPPPTAWSCPWYELIEIPGWHWCVEKIGLHERDGTRIPYVAQCPYVYLGQTIAPHEDGQGENRPRLSLAYGAYRFEAENAYCAEYARGWDDLSERPYYRGDITGRIRLVGTVPESLLWPER